MSNTKYKGIFAGNIDISLKTAINISKSYPSSAATAIRLSSELKSAEKKREKHLKDGIHIPPLMIVSTTDACNLTCSGCYSCAKNEANNETISEERTAEILDEASDLGVSIVMLAGGEPLLSRGWLDSLAERPEMVGIVFSNGTLFDKNRIEWFSENSHIIPTLSIEGDETKTDSRRGEGVYQRVTTTMEDLKNANIPFGLSITLTSQNINHVLSDEFTKEYIDKGCRLFFYVEYVPMEAGTEPLVLSKADKVSLSKFADKSATKFPALFIPFPGDEDQYGGCLAAGRGFIHVSTNGDVEPCPFAPFSDSNLKTTSLKEAMSSSFLAKVRENHHLLKEGDGGCALWHNKEWLEEILNTSELIKNTC